MKDLLEYIVPQIVNHPDEVEINKNEQDGIVYLTIKTHPDDIGRVIGKNGRIINSLRHIAYIIAIKNDVKVNIDIADSKPKAQSSESESEVEANSTDNELETELDVETETQAEESNEQSPNQDEDLIPQDGLDLQTE